MTFRGLLNCDADYRSPWFNQAETIGAMGTIDQQIFVTIFKWLSGSVGQSLGIRLRAHNFGRNNDLLYNFGWRSGGSSSMSYWDEDAPAGNNAFGVFEFTNATPPLWICLQYHAYSANSGLTPNSSPTTPTYPQSSAGPTGNEDGVFISCALRQDGTRPWNGTTNNTGSDTKTSPVWNSGSIIFPRASADGGDRELAADGVMRLTPRAGSIRGVLGGSDSTFVFNPTASFDKNSGVYHVIASEDSFLFTMDPKGIGNYGCFFYMGKYDQIRTALSESLNWCNYVCLQMMNNDSANNRPILPRYGESIFGGVIQPYGTRNIIQTAFPTTGSSANPDNGLFESWIGGGANNVYTNKVEACIIDRNQLLEDTNIPTPIYLRHPNRAISDPTGRSPGKFDMFTIPIACFGDHFGYGKLGEISAFYMVFGIPSNATINNKQWAVVGDSQIGTVKLAIPWDGISDPGTAGGRGGIPF